MRISTSWTYQSSLYEMQTLQSNLSDTQIKMSSGQKYLNAAENPIAATELLNFNENIQVTQQYQSNIGAAQEKLQMESSSLSSAVSTLQSIQSLTIQGLNGINSAQNSQQIATQIDQLNQQLLSIANTKDANGDYIFSGTATNVAPYTYNLNPNAPTTDTVSTDPTSFTYNGNNGKVAINIGPANRQVTNGDSGDDVFGAIAAAPLTQGTISNAFQAISQLANDLNNNTPNSASLTDINNALTRMETVQASVGARLQALSSQQNINAQTILDNQSTSSKVGNLDYAAAVTQLDQQQTALQASQMAFTKVQSLSLFQYIQ